MQSRRRAVAVIHLGALSGNYEYIKSQIRSDCKICAMVKADGYGHGIVETARTLAACGADYFGVADMSEAQRIRDAGIVTPVLMMGYTSAEDMPKLIQLNLTQTVFDYEYARLLNDTVGGRVRCHLKIDTGMSRLGYICEGGKPTQELLNTLRLPNLDFEGIYTHFARSDEPGDPMTRRQFENLTGVISALDALGFHFKIRHAANSGAIMNFPEMQLDMVRPGIMLYGLMPDGSHNPALRPVLELCGTVELVKNVPAGHTVSYGATYRCDGDTRVAVVSLGYADGVSRALSSKGEVFIAGKRARILGKVCMDHLIADVSGIDGIGCGCAAYIIGGGADGITADEVAAVEGTVSYEVLCRMVGSRVVKEFVQ